MIEFIHYMSDFQFASCIVGATVITCVILAWGNQIKEYFKWKLYDWLFKK